MTSPAWKRFVDSLFSPGVLDTRLGRSLVLKLFIVGVLPLLLFAALFYWQSARITERLTRERLDLSARESQLRFAQALNGEAAALGRWGALQGARPRSDTPPALFTRTVRLDRRFRAHPRDSAQWFILTPRQQADLETGFCALLAPRPLDGAMLATLVVPLGERGFVAGELPLRRVLGRAASKVTDADYLLLIEPNGRILYSRPDCFGERIEVPDGMLASRYGRAMLSRAGEVVWAYAPLDPSPLASENRWLVFAAYRASSVFELPALLLKMLLVLTLVSLCIVVVLAYVEARRLMDTVGGLQKGLGRVVGGDWSVQVDSARRDELGDIAADFNLMTATLRRTYEDNLRLTGDAMVGRLAAMVAHQVNTPLAAIRSKLETLSARDAEAAKALPSVIAQVDRIGEIVKTLLGFARLQSGKSADTALAEVVSNTTALFQEAFAKEKIRLTAAPVSAALKARCDARDVQEILVNLVENALESSRAKHALRADHALAAPDRDLEVRVAAAAADGWAELVVEDEGMGFKDPVDQLFTAFFTTKVTGSGLGLAICRRICDEAGGSIRAEHRPGGGARFVVRLPLAAEKR